MTDEIDLIKCKNGWYIKRECRPEIAFSLENAFWEVIDIENASLGNITIREIEMERGGGYLIAKIRFKEDGY